MAVNKEATIVTYISSKKQDIVANSDNFSFNVLPFYMEWNGRKGEINRIEIINDGVRHNNEKSTGKNYQNYQQFAPDATQTDIWSEGQMTAFFSEGVAKAEIKGQTLIIDGNHYVSMWRGFVFEPFELVEIDEDYNKEGRDNKLILKIKERGIVNNSSQYFSPTITKFLINFGTTGAGMHEYAAKLQVGKKYHFNGGRLEKAKILTGKWPGSGLGTRLDINNSVNDIPEIRLFNEEGEVITHDFPHNDNSQVREKLLCNLDKISLDPLGYLANAEIIKGNEVEENYNGRKVNNSDWSAWNDKVHKIEIEGKEINLVKLEWKDKLAVRKAIIAAIKSNPQDWKIENSNIYANPSQGIPDSFKILRHKSGHRHWNVGILHLNESYEQGQKDWAEIEALLSGSTMPEFNNNKNNSISDTEKERIRQYFLKNDIKEIRFENGELIITHNNNEMRNLQQIFHDSKLLEIMNFCQRNNKNKITRESLNIDSNNTSTSPNNPKSNNHQLAIGLALGAGAVILVGVVVYFTQKRKKK